MRRVPLTVLAALALACCSGEHHTATASPSSRSTTRPATARPGQVSVNQREAERNGLHYTLTLETPTVTPFAIVRETVRVDNRSSHRVTLGRCVLGSIAVRAPGAVRPAPSYACGAGISLAPGASYAYGARTMAPFEPGEYVVFSQPVAADAPPPSLLAPIG